MTYEEGYRQGRLDWTRGIFNRAIMALSTPYGKGYSMGRKTLLAFTLLLCLFVYTTTEVQAYPVKCVQTPDGVTRCTWYEIIDTVTACPQGLPEKIYRVTDFYPAGGTIYIKQATARIWGKQVMNGGFIALQVQYPGNAYAEVVIAYDGQLQNTLTHPQPGVPMGPGDGLLVEMTCATVLSPDLARPFPFPGDRMYAFNLWFTNQPTTP